VATGAEKDVFGAQRDHLMLEAFALFFAFLCESEAFEFIRI
jgi:hypothetical protein